LEDRHRQARNDLRYESVDVGRVPQADARSERRGVERQARRERLARLPDAQAGGVEAGLGRCNVGPLRDEIDRGAGR
jgi:hypothetical protein